jgi:hypothetical protein
MIQTNRAKWRGLTTNPENHSTPHQMCASVLARTEGQPWHMLPSPTHVPPEARAGAQGSRPNTFFLTDDPRRIFRHGKHRRTAHSKPHSEPRSPIFKSYLMIGQA